MFMTSI
jgi:hypothetical protein